AIVGAFLISTHSVGSFWYLLRVELPFYKSLGRLSLPTLMTLVASSSIRTLALIALAIALLKWQGGNWESKLLVAGLNSASHLSSPRERAFLTIAIPCGLFYFCGWDCKSSLACATVGRLAFWP